MQDLVLRDRNHPSVIMWSIGNEVIERTEPAAVEIAEMLASSVKEIDATRPVTSGMTTWGQGWEVFDSLMDKHDICGYNYQQWRAPEDHVRVPERVIVGTESYPRDAFSMWKLVSEHNYVIGDFVWTAIDYLGESGIGAYYYPDEDFSEHWVSSRFPWHGAYCGDIDLLGWRKPVSHYRSMLYNDDEKLYMAVREPNPDEGDIRLTEWAVWPTWESWTWPGHEGKDIEVEVYSKYPAVRLYVNGALVGEKQTGVAEEFKALFTLPYAPGEIRAVGIANGEEKESTALQTAGRGVLLALSADRDEIAADGQDLSYITVHITDENGLIDPNASNKLAFEIEGPGRIVAVDNANLKDSVSYVANSRDAWKGKALVIVRSTGDAGVISLKVTSPDLKGSTINIQTIGR
jgi:beta-galactosidase